MKIWIINHYGEVPPQGNYLRQFRFSKELQKMGHEVEMFSASTVHNSTYNHSKDSRPFKKVVIEGVPVTFIKCRNYKGNGKDRVLNILDYFFGVQKATKNLAAPDIVYSSSPHPLNWLAADRIAKRSGAKHVAETRDLWPETFVMLGKVGKNHPMARLLYGLERFIYQKADALIFTFPGHATYLEEMNITPKGEVYYLNNGVDLEEFDRNTLEYPCQDLVMKSEKFKVVYTGALGLVNGMQLLIDTARLLKDERDLEFVIYGDGNEREILEKQAENLPVRFMGRVEKKYIPGILDKADLTLMLTKKTPMHYKYGVSLNKLFEYMASGTPILSNIETRFDIVEDVGAGRTIGSENPEDLAKEILYFKNLSESENEKYCLRAREGAATYDFKVLSQKLEKIFLDLKK